MNTPVKVVSRVVLSIYLFALVWLVLFKFSSDLFGVLLDYQNRSLSLIPFEYYSQGNLWEMLDNLVVFIPFGLLLGVTFKQTSILRKLVCIFVFSFAAEVIQFALAIGTSDITDIITNTAGGLIGLILYSVGSKYFDNEKMDWFIVATSAILLIACMLLRIFVFQVQY